MTISPTREATVTCNLCGTAITDLSDGETCSRCLSGVQWAGSDRAEAGRAVAEVGDPAEDRRRRTAELRRGIVDALDSLPEVYGLLPLFTEPGSTPPDPDGPRGKGSPKKAPVRLEVLDLLDEREKADAEAQRLDYDIDRRAGARRQGILPTLVSWVRLVDGELWDEDLQHAGPSDAPTVATECAWIRGHVGWIIEQQWAGELAADLEQMFADCRSATGWKRPEPLRCNSCGWAVEERDGGAWFSCTGDCGRSWSRVELHRMVEQNQPKTLAECASLTGLSDRTLREYKAAGEIAPVGRRGAADLYDYEQVHAATMRSRYRKVS